LDTCTYTLSTFIPWYLYLYLAVVPMASLQCCTSDVWRYW